MAELVVIVVVFVIIVLVRATSSGTPSYARIVKVGVPARGILLSVSQQPLGTTGVRPWRYTQRAVVMDIEMPGHAPYQVAVTPFIPTNLVDDVLPGATVELRIDPKRPTQIAIVGPGVGFNTALLNAGSGMS